MATQPKVNPTLPNVARHFNGKSVTAVKVTLNVDVTDEFGPNGVIQEVYEELQQNATPIIIGQVVTLGTGDFDVYFEGDFQETDDYGSAGNLSFIADLQARLRTHTEAGKRDAVTIAASGETANTSGLDLSGATVAAITTLVDDTDGTAGLVGDGGVDIS